MNTKPDTIEDVARRLLRSAKPGSDEERVAAHVVSMLDTGHAAHELRMQHYLVTEAIALEQSARVLTDAANAKRAAARKCDALSPGEINADREARKPL